MKTTFSIPRLMCLALGLLITAATVRTDGAPPLFGPRYEPFNGEIRFIRWGKLPHPSKPGSFVTGPVSKPFTVNVKKPLDDISQRLVDTLNTELPKQNLNFRGFRPYNIRITRSASPEMQVETAFLSSSFSSTGSDIKMKYILRGNSIDAKFTTPDIVNTRLPIIGPIKFGLDRAADPRIILHFDLEVEAVLTPQLQGAPRVKSVQVKVQNARLRPANFSADVLNAANDFVAWVGGPNFRVMAEKAINAQSISVRDPLTGSMRSIDNHLAPLTKGARSMRVEYKKSSLEVIYSDDPPPPPPVIR
jgi:hypothetical protein